MRQLTARVTDEIRTAVANISNNLLPALDDSAIESGNKGDYQGGKSSRLGSASVHSKAKSSAKR